MNIENRLKRLELNSEKNALLEVEIEIKKKIIDIDKKLFKLICEDRISEIHWTHNPETGWFDSPSSLEGEKEDE